MFKDAVKNKQLNIFLHFFIQKINTTYFMNFVQDFLITLYLILAKIPVQIKYKH